MPLKRVAALAAFLLILTAAVTYPQILHVSDGVADFGDPLLNAWALCWVPHALIAQPLSLFDANIFYPQHGALAFSESLIAPALLAAPLRALGVNGIAIHNLTLLSGYVLSGLAMFAFVRYLTGDVRAAIVSAALFTMTPLRAEHYPRVQLQMTYLMPLALLYTCKIIDGGAHRVRNALLLGACLGLQFYSCVYYAIFLATILPVFGITYLLFARTDRVAALKWLAIGVVSAALLIAPAAPVYMANHEVVGDRSMQDVRRGSAEPRDYRRPTGTNWLYDGYRGEPPERHLFTGYLPIALAAAGVLAPPARWIPLAAGSVVAWDASLGVNGRTYGFLYEYALPYRAIRVPARMAMVLTMLMAALAGLGCVRIFASTRSTRIRNAAVVVLTALALLESANRPLELRSMSTKSPAVYDWLAEQPAGAVVEYPVAGLEGRSSLQDAVYMYYSTRHWQPLLNGYSGFTPPLYDELLQKLATFPSATALDYLRARHARYLLVHERFYLRGGFEADIEELGRTPALNLKSTFIDRDLGRTVVYEFRDTALLDGGRTR